jgi:pimeloyl-ACP methyl ester carboxylesterase
MPDRLTRAAVLVGLAPQGAVGLDWYDGMTQFNVAEYAAAADGYQGLAAQTEATAKEVRENPASLLASLHPEMPDSDRRVVADPGIRAQLLQTYAEALRTSADGWIDDVLAFKLPWGFDPASISVPVLLWHGAVDNFSPVSHAMWLAQRIPSATVVVQAGAAHFSALDVLPDILRWLSSEPRTSQM